MDTFTLRNSTIMHTHELTNDFPELSEKIHVLKSNNAHFLKLYDDYHEVNKEIHRIETGNEIASDEHLHKQRTHRVFLKDELYKWLTTK